MPSRGQRRGTFNPEPMRHEKSSIFNVEDASDSNIKWTSTPLKRLGPDRLRRRFSTPVEFDSEGSTDVKSSTRPVPRQRSAKSLKRIESSDRRGKRRGKSRRRRSEGHGDDLAQGSIDLDDTTPAGRKGGGNRGSEKHRSETNSRRQEGYSAELPIAELLRKAQKNQKNPQPLKLEYEEPIAFPELTTNTVYVQGRNGFSAVKLESRRSTRNGTEKLSKPINVAIRMHNLSRSVMFLCQGLLGGIALSQVVLVTKVCADLGTLEQINGSNYSRVMSGVFLFLNTVCLLSAMDRIDLAHLDLENLREITCHRCMLLLTLPLYFAAICIHLTVTNDDENLLACSGRELQSRSEVVGIYFDIDDANVATQRDIYVWKFALCIAGWICVALGPTDDMTATHLEAMQNYAN